MSRPDEVPQGRRVLHRRQCATVASFPSLSIEPPKPQQQQRGQTARTPHSPRPWRKSRTLRAPTDAELPALLVLASLKGRRCVPRRLGAAPRRARRRGTGRGARALEQGVCEAGPGLEQLGLERPLGDTAPVEGVAQLLKVGHVREGAPLLLLAPRVVRPAHRQVLEARDGPVASPQPVPPQGLPPSA